MWFDGWIYRSPGTLSLRCTHTLTHNLQGAGSMLNETFGGFSSHHTQNVESNYLLIMFPSKLPTPLPPLLMYRYIEKDQLVMCEHIYSYR